MRVLASRRAPIPLLAMATALAGSAAPALPGAATAGGPRRDAARAPASPARLIVKTSGPAAVAAALGAPAPRRFLPEAPAASRTAGVPRAPWVLVDLPEGTVPGDAIARILALGLAEAAEPDGVMRGSVLPSDPYASSSGSWGQSAADQWGVAAVRLPAAWDQARGSPGVVVAIVDSGVDLLHADLPLSRWTNPGEVPGNGVDDDGNGYVDDVVGYDFATAQGGRDPDPTDGLGHGTLVAGIASGDTDNGLGTAGASWGCRVMSLKALDDTGTGYVSDIGAAVLYAVDNGAAVINLSMNGSGTSPFLESTVAAARAAGVLVVASAGNLGIDVRNVLPANIDDVVVVSGLNPWLQPAYWSNFGATVDLAAPGTDILGPRALGTDFYQNGLNVVGTDSFRASGTSFAAALTSGVAALVASASPGVPPDALAAALAASARDVGAPGFDADSGFGILTADAALSRVRDMVAHVDAPASRQVLSFGAPLAVTGSATGSDLASWQLFLGAGEVPATFAALTAPSGIPVVAGPLYSGPSTAHADGVYTLRLLATSQDGVVYEDRRLVEIDNSRGRVTGSVAWEGDGSPALGVVVWAYDQATGSPVTYADMGAGGTFQFTAGLPAGTYAMYADASASEFNAEFWQDSLSLAGATPVVVTPGGNVGGIDMQLSRRPRLAGTVRDGGGTPLPGQVVELLFRATQTVAASTGTAADGRYQLQRLPTGDFYVRARAGDASSRPEYWQEAPVVGQATVVTLAANDDVQAVDFSLVPYTASLAGEVRSGLGPPLAGFPVELLPVAGGFFRSTVTDSQGQWLVTRLPPGGYRVRTGANLDWELQYFDRKPRQSAADVVHLLDGVAVTGIDLTLGGTWFRDVTSSSGTLVGPESYDTIGVVPARLDGDDRPDLYLVNQVGPNSFLLQDGSGGFVDDAVPRGAGAADLKAQATVLDMDNDGDADVFVPKYGRFGAPSVNLLLRNDGARFRDATYDAGVVEARVGLDACAGDYDADGYLDLYVVHSFDVKRLYRNRGDGTFQDVSAASGTEGSANNNAQAATFADVDGDGDQDLLVVASEFPTAGRGNLLYVNQGNGTFTEEGQARGVMAPPGAYNATFGDVDADGDLDLYVGSSYGGVAYENDGTGRFTDRTAAWGLSGIVESAGCSFGDVDGDGHLDLVIADYVGGLSLHTGSPSGAFQDRTHLAGAIRYGQSKQLALVDLDLDGRLDIVLTHDYRDNRIYRNRTPPRSYIELKLRGKRSNRDGIGARVEATAGGRTQIRICGTGDAGNRVDPSVHFGLGAATTVDLVIRWPSGIVQALPATPVDQLLHVTEPIGQALVTGPGPGSGNPSTVRIFDERGDPLPVAFDAYAGAAFGVRPVGAELSTLATSQEIATMPGPGPRNAAHVRAFREDGAPVAGASFFAYGTLAYGGSLAAAEGYDPLASRLLAAPGPGAALAPHLRGFTAAGAALPGLSFLSHPGLGYGASPAVLDVDGDGRDEIVAAPGPGAGYWSHVRTFRYAGSAVTAVPGGSFHAFAGPTQGARPAGGQGILVVAPGPGPLQPSRLLGFAYGTGSYAPLPGFDATVYPGLGYGAAVGLASIDATGFLEAVTAPGPGPAYQAHVRAVGYSGSATQLLPRPSFLAYGPTIRYGGDVASLTLD